MMTFLLWLLLLIFCWPLALLALILWPLVWLIALPFRLLGFAVDGVFEFLRALFLCLPEFCAGRVRHDAATTTIPFALSVAPQARSRRVRPLSVFRLREASLRYAQHERLKNSFSRSTTGAIA